MDKQSPTQLIFDFLEEKPENPNEAAEPTDQNSRIEYYEAEQFEFNLANDKQTL